MESTPKPAFISKQVLHGRYVFVDLTPSPSVDFTLVCAGREECAPNYRVERSGFRYHALEYIVGGRWELTLGRQVHELGPGSVFCYGPRVGYTLRVLDATQAGKFFVDFAGHRAESLLERSRPRNGVPGRLNQTRWIHDIFDQILDGANLSRTSARSLGTHLTELLLMRLPTDLRAPASPHPESHRSYIRCRAFIQQHYLRLRTIENVAQASGLSPAYLARLFRRFANETPLQYLTRLKMDHAAELVLRGDYAVKQAAAAVGFDDPYHFSRVFKRVHGVAPGRFASSLPNPHIEAASSASP